jgi:EmrB/QacA subfamily drug resistance transporter
MSFDRLAGMSRQNQQEEVDVTETATRSTSGQRWVLALTALASLMVMLDMLVVTTALPTIRMELGASISELEWTISAFTLSFAVLLMTASALGDRLGRRRVFVAGIGLFTASSVACALAGGIGTLVAARAVQGAGSAMVMPHALALLSAAYPPRQRPRALGIFTSVTGLATLGGPIVGGVIVQGLAWQWIFWLNVPLGVLLIPLVLRRIEESTGPRTPIDVGGLVLVTGGALGLVWGLVRGNAAGWTSVEVVGALLAGAALVVVFVRWELRATAPMLPMRLFRTPAFSSGNAAGFLMFGSIVGTAFLVPQFLQTALGYDPLGAGLRLAPWTVMLSLVAPIAGGLVNRVGERRLIVGGLLLQAAGFGWIASVASPDMGYAGLVPPLVLAGCGVSLAMPAAQNAVIGAVPPALIGKASGTYNTLRQLGGTFGIATLAAVFSGAGSYASPKAFADGFVPAIAVAATLSLAAAVAGSWTPGRRAATREPVPASAPSPTPELQAVIGQ